MNHNDMHHLRDLPRAEWYKAWRIIRKYHGNPSADSYTEKQSVIEQINKYAIDGKVRLCSRFMDCDCAISTTSSLIPANWYAVDRAMNEEYGNAEGRGSCWIESPEVDPPSANFRDLALEAHENGHPHVVYA